MRKLLLVVVCSAITLNITWAAAPFGRMMPMHYGPEDIRTIVAPKTEKTLTDTARTSDQRGVAVTLASSPTAGVAVTASWKPASQVAVTMPWKPASQVAVTLPWKPTSGVAVTVPWKPVQTALLEGQI